MIDHRPLGCRFRLQDEGKAYPRSSCASCGKTIATGLGARCTAERFRDTHRVDRLELALYLIVAHGNITGDKAREIAAEALGISKPV